MPLIFWLGASALVVLSIAVLLWPLLRNARGVTNREQYHRAVYRDQMAEIDADLASGEIDPESVRLARAEIGRRVLAEAALGSETASSRVPRWALGSALVAPLAAVLLYLWLGHPMPIASEHGAAGNAQMDQLVEKLAARLKDEPNDLEGWKLLARSNVQLGRHADAVEAYRRALSVDKDKDPALIGDYAESLAMSNNAVIPEARRAFEAVLESDPKNARARHYLAEERAEAGALDEALTRWQLLASDTPADAAYLPLILGRIKEMARRLNRDPQAAVAGLPAPAARVEGPSRADIDTAETMSDEERGKMIEGMVARLAQRLEADPNDLAGWLKLAHAQLVLGRAADALRSFEQAVKLDPARIEALTGRAQALRQSAGAQDPRYFAALGAVLKRDPEDAEALFVLGAEALKRGDRDDAKEKWNRLLAGIPKTAPERAETLAQMHQMAAAAKADTAGLLPSE